MFTKAQLQQEKHQKIILSQHYLTSDSTDKNNTVDTKVRYLAPYLERRQTNHTCVRKTNVAREVNQKHRIKTCIF